MISEHYIKDAIKRNWTSMTDAPPFDEESELYRDIHRQLDPVCLGYFENISEDNYITEHDTSDWIEGEPYILTDEDDAISASSWSAVYHHCTQVNPWLEDVIFLKALYDVFEEMQRIKGQN